jgi:hypothetical protein
MLFGILVPESDIFIIYGEDTSIGYCYPMDITAQILEDSL